ncbi:cobyric acid synthase CobQ (plasmid) [Emticicia oligotrophica DSM 17448]|uniref:Cobyric acid synthase CobQ n=1 Tax=Emticicia oligotrophica (strain DSM 17448 / CIP 109782 / MTCC 6937 / GPTSA100-15) TaxID=929562 RepID=A0ABM5N7G5_EMTOG|nr:hypothetical protein [Emticicia oligotrophica]AFK05473.1 cobyric acid synthase CobQ [Emticicia oligotrophica DSM 17448]
MNSKITYFPVDNGDTSLISIVEENLVTNIIVDCNIRESSTGDTDLTKFDVKKALITSLKRKKVNDTHEVPYTDCFILTHGDYDHLRGFEKNFYQGDPLNYKEKNKNNGEILINELWFSPMVMGKSTTDDEDCFNKEAKRRIKLHKENNSAKNNDGNRIIIVGYDDNEKLIELDDVRKIPGNIVSVFNGQKLKTFSIFIHAPYKHQLSISDPNKNHTSVVFQARFKRFENSTEFCTLAMFGGDSDHFSWDVILEKTKKYKNEKALEWDIFLAPHHCSWTFFNDTPQVDNPTPVDTSLQVLDYKRNGAKVIASCKEIKNNDDNPPHFKAKEQYVKKVKDAANFLNTATHIKNGKTPQPIVFEITSQGPMPPKKSEGSAIVAGTSSLGALNQPSTYGSKPI